MKIQLLSGINLECDDNPFDSGSMGKIFRTVDSTHVIKFYKNPNSIDREALKKILSYQETIQNSKIKKTVCWPLDMVTSPQLGVILPRVPDHFISLKWLVRAKTLGRIDESERGNWLERTKVAITICTLINYLHKLGMIITDIAPHNFYVSFSTQEVIMLDCDGIIAPGLYSPHVLGTPEYQAPEILSGQHLSQLTDLHALAVTLYRLFFLRHPLLGPKIHSQDPDEDDFLALGTEAVYIENPFDRSNRPTSLFIKASDITEELDNLFKQVFIYGLREPAKRPTATKWINALQAIEAKLMPCDNPKCFGRYSIPRSTDSVCYWCSSPYIKQKKVKKDSQKKRDGRQINQYNISINNASGITIGDNSNVKQNFVENDE